MLIASWSLLATLWGWRLARSWAWGHRKTL